MRKILLYLALCLSVSFVCCIFNGKDVKGGNHSFVVSLQNKESHHFCCGALITVKFVLTAASCVKDRRPHDFIVVGGITNLDDRNGTRMLIDKVISRNPGGQNDVRNNIALISLMEYIEISEYLHPINLAEDADQEAKVGESCRIYGWGRKSKNAIEATNTLKEAKTKIRNQTECRNIFFDVNGTLLCIFDAKASLCQYDTGNPLVSKQGHYLWGIATEQHWCGNLSKNKFDVYTRVDSYKEWIWNVVEENSASTWHKRQILTGIIVLLMIILD